MILLMLAFSLLMVPLGHAATRLGLHVTQEELNVWRQRATNGPYRVAGDVSTNSPGDYTRIKENADSFLDSFRGQRQQHRRRHVWSGHAADTCMEESSAMSGPGLDRGVKLRDAGLVYLITENTHYRNALREAVRDTLLDQGSIANANLANTPKFSNASGCLSGTAGQKIQQINAWVQQLAYGYDYIRSSLTDAQRDTLDAWFLGAANFLNSYPVAAATARWPQRSNNDYDSSPHPRGACENDIRYSTANPYAEASCRYHWQGAWNNLNLSHARTAGTIGVMLNHTPLIDDNKRFMKEWLAYMIYPDGSSGELDRWTHSAAGNDNPNLGMGYWGGTLDHYVTLAEALCRIGDCELYTYSTSAGRYGTAGGPKSLLSTITAYLRMREHTIVRYAAKSASAQTSVRIMDGVHSTADGAGQNYHTIGDVWAAPANQFYNSAFIKGHYMRTSADPQVLDYPAKPAGGQLRWGGTQMSLPGILFMVGDMEAVVDPYPIGPAPGVDLVGWWQFENNATDSSPAGNHGTASGTTYTTRGPLEGTHSLPFDAATDYFSIPVNFFNASQGTLFLSISATSFAAGPQYIFGCTTSPPYANRLQVYTDESTGMLKVGMGGTHALITNAFDLAVDTTYRLGVRWGNGVIDLFVGVAGVSSNTKVASAPYTGFDRFGTCHIGNTGNTAQLQGFAGRIDDVKVYNRALTDTEMLEGGGPPPPIDRVLLDLGSCQIGAVCTVVHPSTTPTARSGMSR